MKTRKLPIWPILAATLSSGCTALHGQEPTTTPAVATPAKDVVIDGKLNEACWQEATTTKADYRNVKGGGLSEEPRGTVKYVWDNDYLYIGYETFDTNLTTMASGDVQGPKGNQRPGCEIWSPDGNMPDVVEFFISVNDPNYMWELHHNAANQFNDLWCVIISDDRPFRKSIRTPYGIRFCDEEYLQDDGNMTFQSAVSLKPKTDGSPSTINEEGTADTGYTAELRIPWRSLDVPSDWGYWADSEGNRILGKHKGKKFWTWRPVGKDLRILMVIQDSDLKTRYHHSSPGINGGWFHHQYDQWPEYILSRDTPARE